MARFLKYSPILTSFLVALAGLMSLAQVLTITVHHHRFGRIDDSLLPFTAAQNSRLFIVITGLVLLYLSSQIYRRKYLAYQLVSLGLALLIGVELLLSKNRAQLALYVITLGLLLITRSQYIVASNNLSLRRGALISCILILVVFCYATIGFSRLSSREVDTQISLPAAMKYAGREIFTFQESQLPLRTRNAELFVLSVNTAAVVAYGLAIFSLFRPLEFQYGASKHERELASRILAAHSTNTDDFFKLWPPDKHYFFSEAEDSFVAYKVIGSDALVLEGPSGNPASFTRLLTRFADFCQRSGWSAAYISAGEGLDKHLGHDQYQRIFIGNEAVIDVTLFASETYRSKHFRYIKNRAERDGIRFEYWQAPLASQQLQQLRKISDEWLSQRSRREYTFALGYFDPEYIQNCDAAVLTRDGKVIAYANVVPGFATSARTIDHMRYRRNMPSTGMHFLLMQLILRLGEQGVTSFNLGLAPLSGLESREAGNLPERMLTALKKLGSRYYSFGGLEQFKNKFEPQWQPRYIYYQGTPARLLSVATSLTRAVNVPIAGRTRHLIVVAASIIAALCYDSFPLVLVFKPRNVLHGLVSELGAAGGAHAGLFNALDILSSLLVFLVIWLLWNSPAAATRRYRQILILLGLSALGNLLAAVTPLPTRVDSNLQFALHDIFSAVNILAIIGAAFLFLFVAARKRLWVLLFSLLMLAVILTILLKGHLGGVIAQRMQILITGVWIVGISAYLSRLSKPTGA